MASHRHLRVHLARYNGHTARPRIARLNGKNKDINDAVADTQKATEYMALADSAKAAYEGCIGKKKRAGKKRDDLYPCKKVPAFILDGFMAKKGNGKCASESVFVANCRVKYNTWQTYLGWANSFAKEASKTVADVEGVSLTAASQMVDEIMYEADPKAFQEMQATMFDAYVAKTGLEPPSPKDYQEAFVPDTPVEEDSGSLLPILLGVAGVGALGFLGYSLFSD